LQRLSLRRLEVPEYTTANQIPLNVVPPPFSHVRILARHSTGIQKIEFATWRSGEPAVRVWLSKTGGQQIDGVWEIWEGDLPTAQTVETNYTGYFDIYANDGSRKEYSFQYIIAVTVRSVALVVTPAPWVVGQTLTLKATVTDDGRPAVGELVRFDIILPSAAYDLPNGMTDALGVATINWVIPETRGDTPVAEQNVSFRAFDNATMTVSNYVSGYVGLAPTPQFPWWVFGLMAAGIALAVVGKQQGWIK